MSTEARDRRAGLRGDDRLDPLLVDPTRLAITALLGPLQWAEFGLVRDEVGVSDSALSKQAATLERAGYLEVRKGHVGKRPRTWYALTGPGHDALTRHVAALREIADRAAGAAARTDAPGQPPGS